ncbi:DUF3558 domain-containing protein [Amycolatopsis sp. NPDC005232]|uniref:DUF3558 domain-containing protein n=1 Tax=Amycolatopsis sp. NPDC005232 TaxID=3157027 RepID=UPI0033A7CC70
MSRGFVPLVVAAALLTSCSGTAEPAAPTTSAAATSGPQVPSPLPTNGLLSDPCGVLTEAEAGTVGLASPGKEDTSTAKGCTWKSSSSEPNQIALTPLPRNTGGIGDVYAQKAKDAYFEPVSISGYPGAYADVQDARSQGSCTLWVGVTDQLAVSVIPQIQEGPHQSDPCGVAQNFAAAMITHLKAQT